MKQTDMILAQGKYYDTDCYKTKLNNNVLVVGASGTGKTRNIVTPNLIQASGSYIVSDPKGNLYKKYKAYLQAKGYKVRLLDFVHPEKSIGYNPLSYLEDEQDILKVARSLSDMGGISTHDPFWDNASELLFTSLIAYLVEFCPPHQRNLTSIQKLLLQAQISENMELCSGLDCLMNEAQQKNPESFAARQYYKFRVGADRTLKSILITATTKLGVYDSYAMRKMLQKDQVNLTAIGKEKTALFVVVSDTDRSMDTLANLFFSQAMNELCKYADEKCAYNDYRLPIDVRFILDDFATNVTICEFPRMIASIRSRGISTMLMIQAESQLDRAYHEDGKTIIGNCDTYVYLGGNDTDTAKAVSNRCDVPLKKILNMPVSTCWIFRRGSNPVEAKLYEPDFSRVKMEKEEVL